MFIQAACLDDAKPEELGEAPVRYLDNLNDNVSTKACELPPPGQLLIAYLRRSSRLNRQSTPSTSSYAAGDN